MRRRFFVERFVNGTAKIEGESAQHLGRVLRAEPGQLYELSDGKAVFLSRVEKVGRGAIEFATIESVAARVSRLRATLLLSVVKFDRFEWALEKSVELGVETIVPLAAGRSEKALVAAAPKRAQRWRKVLLESAQQARCLRVPALEDVRRSTDAFRDAADSIRILLSERPQAPALKPVLEAELGAAAGISDKEQPKNVTLAVGPEGGWTDAEFTAAGSAGFREARIGENVLRTETAVIAGLAAIRVCSEGT